ncbi:MAG: hypothetical protein WCT28_04110 [Patescibacteria group bacterium]|jgi:hypothetical protein
MDLSLVHALIDALYLGQTDFARAKREQLERLLLEKPQSMHIIARLLTKRSESNPSGFDIINKDVTDVNFPSVCEPFLEGAELKCYGNWVSFDFVCDDFATRSRRAATVAEALLYYVTHLRDLSNRWIVALGQYLEDGAGTKQVVILGKDQGLRYAKLEVVNTREQDFLFLSFPIE